MLLNRVPRRSHYTEDSDSDVKSIIKERAT